MSIREKGPKGGGHGTLQGFRMIVIGVGLQLGEVSECVNNQCEGLVLVSNKASDLSNVCVTYLTCMGYFHLYMLLLPFFSFSKNIHHILTSTHLVDR